MPDDVGVAGLHPMHPLNIAHQRKTAGIARAMSSAPMLAGLQRPDSGGGLNINQAMPSSAELMRPQATSLADPFHNQASQSGIEAMGGGGGFGRLTGGGAQGSLHAALSGEARGKELMAGMPKLEPFAPSWTPSEQMAGKPRPANLGQAQGPDPLVAAHMNYQGPAAAAPPGPQGVAASAPQVGKFAPPAAAPKHVAAAGPQLARQALQAHPPVGNRQQVAREMARRQGGGQRQVPLEGINQGIGGIGQMLGRLFAGGGGGGQAQAADDGLGVDPGPGIHAQGEIDAKNMEAHDNFSGALDHRMRVAEIAAERTAQWRDANVRATHQRGVLAHSAQELEATKAANAATAKHQADLLKVQQTSAPIEDAYKKAETDKLTREAAMDPTTRAISEGVRGGRLPPEALASALQRQELLKTGLQKWQDKMLTSGEAEELLTTPNNPFGRMISPTDYAAIFPKEPSSRPGLDAFQRMRELHYPVGPEYQGQGFNDLARMLVEKQAGPENWRRGQAQPQFGTLGQGFPTMEGMSKWINPEQPVAPIYRAIMRGLSGYNPFTGQGAAERDYQRASDYATWARGR